MYSSEKNVQILLSLLKEHGIKKMILLLLVHSMMENLSCIHQ